MNDIISLAVKHLNKNNTKLVLAEELQPHHEDRADNWDHFSNVSDETKDKVESALGDRDGYGKKIIPVTSASHAIEDPDVSDHLAKHGWTIKDYHAGTATTQKTVGNPAKGIPHQTKEVESKIGKVLNDTNAPDHIKNTFANDPLRRSKDHGSDLRVMISTHPHAIAGMSTGTKWTSCMDMDCRMGVNNTWALPEDSKHGTHVAYLVHKDDHGANHGTVPTQPLARIALKPFHSDSGDTIFRPEHKTYGSSTTAFENTVDEWAKHHYPAKDGESYTKNKKIYHDVGATKFKTLSKDDIYKKLDRGQAISGDGADGADEFFDKHTVNHAVDYSKDKNMSAGEYSNYVSNISRLPLTPKHVNDLLSRIPEGHDQYKKSTKQTLAIYQGDKFTTNALNTFRQEHKAKGLNDNSLPTRILKNPRLPDDVVDNLEPNQYAHVHPSKLKPHHMDNVLDGFEFGRSGSSYDVSDNMSKFGPEHLDRLAHIAVNDNKMSFVQSVLQNEKTGEKTHDFLNSHLDRNDSIGQTIRMYSKTIKPEHIDSMAFDTMPHKKIEQIGMNEHVSPAVMSKLKDKFMGMTPDKRRITHVPVKMQDHFTDADVDKIVGDHITHSGNGVFDTNINSTLPKKLSNHIMDNVEGRMLETHNKMVDAYDNNTEHGEDGEYTHEFEQQANHLHQLMHLHGNLVDNHVDNHLRPSDSELGSFDHHDADIQHNRIDLAKEIDEDSPHEKITNMVRDGDTYHTNAEENIEESKSREKHHEEYGEYDEVRGW